MIFYPRDPRLVSRSGIWTAQRPSRKRRDDRYEDKEAKLPVHARSVEEPNSGGLFGA